jgi:hypothetical protein
MLLDGETLYGVWLQRLRLTQKYIEVSEGAMKRVAG